MRRFHGVYRNVRYRGDLSIFTPRLLREMGVKSQAKRESHLPRGLARDLPAFARGPTIMRRNDIIICLFAMAQRLIPIWGSFTLCLQCCFCFIFFFLLLSREILCGFLAVEEPLKPVEIFSPSINLFDLEK